MNEDKEGCWVFFHSACSSHKSFRRKEIFSIALAGGDHIVKCSLLAKMLLRVILSLTCEVTHPGKGVGEVGVKSGRKPPLHPQDDSSG